MKQTLLTILAFLTITCFGKQKTEYKIDENLTIQLPEDYNITDTMGQRIINAQVDNGLILILIAPNKGLTAVNIKDENELIEFYKGFQSGILKQANGELISEDIIVKDNLKLKQFSYRATLGGETHIRDCLGLFLNENTYTIQFWQEESMRNEMTEEREDFFNSLKITPGFSFKNQLSNSSEGTRSYRIGYLIGKILGPLLFFGALLYLIRWISKKTRKKSTNVQP